MTSSELVAAQRRVDAQSAKALALQPPAEEASVPPLRATPFRCADPKTIPPRQFLFGGHFHRGYVSVTAGSGGVSKSMRELLDAVSMRLGRDLLGKDRVYGGPKRVWVMNLEDDRTELARRIAAICIAYDLNQADLEDGLFVDSGRDRELVIATESRDGVLLNLLDIEALKSQIRMRKIDVLIVDPFVESHAVSESLNDQIKVVMGQWRQIAHDCSIAVELAHHVRKTGTNEISIDDVRGAVAMIGSARSVRLIAPMSSAEALQFGIDRNERRRYVSVNPHGKANFAAPSDARDWYRLETIALGNGVAPYDEGDRIGVPRSWSLPGPLESVSLADCAAIRALAAAQDSPGISARENKQANGWFGHLVSELLAIDSRDAQGKKEIERILSALVAAKHLRLGMSKSANREDVPVFLPGGSEAAS